MNMKRLFIEKRELLGHLKLPHSSVSWRSWAVSSSSTRWWWWSWVVSAGWGGGYAWWFLVGDMSWAKLPCCGGLSLISRQVSDFENCYLRPLVCYQAPLKSQNTPELQVNNFRHVGNEFWIPSSSRRRNIAPRNIAPHLGRILANCT
jgi:hypothetical protein